MKKHRFINARGGAFIYPLVLWRVRGTKTTTHHCTKGPRETTGPMDQGATGTRDRVTKGLREQRTTKPRDQGTNLAKEPRKQRDQCASEAQTQTKALLKTTFGQSGEHTCHAPTVTTTPRPSGSDVAGKVKTGKNGSWKGCG